MIQKFLVPLDGSEISAQIVPWVSALSRALGSQVTLLTVVPPARDIQAGSGYGRIEDASGPIGGGGGGGTSRGPVSPGGPVAAGRAAQPATTDPGVQAQVQVIDAVRQMAFDYLSAQKAALEERSIATDIHVTSGDPATEIAKSADSLGASVIAMSTRRASSLARGILGSVTDRVLHIADRPMLIMHPREETNGGPPQGWPQCVIVPLDGSQLSETAVPMATEVARSTGARVIFMRAMPQVTTQAASGFTTAAEAEYGLHLEKERLGDTGQRYLHRFVEEARSQGLHAEPQVYGGRAAHRIVELAAENAGSLVVMTTRGNSGLQRWVVGSVADKVVRASGQPVLVLPPIVPETISQSTGIPPRPSQS